MSRRHDIERDPVGSARIILKLLALAVAFAVMIGAIVTLPSLVNRLQDALLALGGAR